VTGPVIVVSSRRAIFGCENEAKARRDAHRWLRSVGAVDGEWVAILDAASGETRKLYQRRNGDVTRMQ
jgi:hypothetical protein